MSDSGWDEGGLPPHPAPPMGACIKIRLVASLAARLSLAGPRRRGVVWRGGHTCRIKYGLICKYLQLLRFWLIMVDIAAPPSPLHAPAALR